MRFLETLLLAAGVGRGVYSRWRIEQVVPILVTAALISAAAVAMMVALAIAAMFAAYTLLMQQGLDQLHALLATMLGSLFVILALVAALRQRVSELKSLTKTPVGKATDAFLSGLLAE